MPWDDAGSSAAVLDLEAYRALYEHPAERARTREVHAVARMRRGDGEPIEVEMTSRLFPGVRGEIRTCTVIRDITERARLERELVESRERLAEAERVAGTGSWEWDMAQDRITWSDGLLELYGLARHAFGGTYDRGLRRVYPEDGERAGHRSRLTADSRLRRAGAGGRDGAGCRRAARARRSARRCPRAPARRRPSRARAG
jgi:PAS domain-containing protein